MGDTVGTELERMNREIVDMVLGVAESKLSFDDLVQWFAVRIIRADDYRAYFLERRT